MINLVKLPKAAIAFLCVAILFTSCKDDEAPAPTGTEVVPDGPNVKINNWIYDVMDEVYYWTDQMPSDGNKNQDPIDYFKSLRNANDRFSHIVPNYQDLMNSLNGVSREAGYEYQLFGANDSQTDVWAVISYVKGNSPAKEAGLKRGDVIHKINGQTITRSNYRELIGKVSETHSIGFMRYEEEAEDLVDQPELTLQTIELAENPNFMDSVYTIGGHKIGYYVYNFFSPGGSQKEYDRQMDQVILDFKNKGITDVILDLRYNSGGAISSATNLASLVGRSVDDSKVFYENRWNSLYQKYWESKEDGDDILRGKFINKADKIGDNLASGRIYILVGSGSASASELIINGLKPYMDVYLIGDKTRGKNVGSIPIENKKDADNDYGLLPIVFQIYNSQGFSDYSNGFVPNDEVNDFKLPMKALGDVEERLLARALEVITGSGARMRPVEEEDRYQLDPIMSSMDNKLRTNRLIYDEPMPEGMMIE